MILESNCSNYFYTFPSASNIFVKMKLEIKSKYSLMYDQLTLFLSTKSSILLQLLQHTKKIIAFLSTWSILYNFKKSREKWQKSSPFLFEFPFCFFNSLSSKFWPTIPIVEPRWNGLIDKIYSRHRRIGEKSGESEVRPWRETRLPSRDWKSRLNCAKVKAN